MYIAFKWLFGLAMAMWVGMCCIDMYIKRIKDNGTGLLYESAYKNISLGKQTSPQIRLHNITHKNGGQKSGVVLLHCTVFLAGAIAVIVFNKKTDILLLTKTRIIRNLREILIESSYEIKQFAITHILAATYFIWKNMLIKFDKAINNILNVLNRRIESKQQKINIILFNKLNEIGEEKNNLEQSLISAIHENKTLRMQYYLQLMAKNRLLQHIEDAQKKIKENRSRYVSFQHLFLSLYQENVFLKARIRKLIIEKEEAERHLLGVINEVNRKKNYELKLYCSRLIVQTKDNLLNSDVNAEIQNFLRKTQRSESSSTKCQLISEEQNINMSTARSYPTHITKVLQRNESAFPLSTDTPKLKGLGEYLWTYKDKNGIIEKLYEYDYESDVDNCETIRMIRLYSVRFNKDCLLDYTNSTTIIYETHSDTRVHSSVSNVGYPSIRGGLVTGSEAFQKFLRDNNNVVPSHTRPPLMCK